MNRTAWLGERWDEHPGYIDRADSFVDAVVELAKELEVPFPQLREEIAGYRRAGMDWESSIEQVRLIRASA